MKFLKEVMTRAGWFGPHSEEDQEEFEDLPPEDEDELYPEDEDIQPDDEEDISPEDEDLPPDDQDLSPEDEDFPPEDEDVPSDDQELDQVANKVTQDPDRMGLIRVIRGAHLVYKRETEDGTFEELWVYNSGESMKDELKLRRAIISGTDIPPTKTESPDGKQSYVVWNAGNGEILQIKGLPN